MAKLGHREAFQDIQDLDNVRAAGGGRRHRENIVPAIVAVNRRPDNRAIVFQVLVRDEAAIPFHFAGNQIGGFAFVKAFHAVVGNALECCRQFRLSKAFPGLPGAAVFPIKGVTGGGPSLESLPGLLQTFSKTLGHYETVLGQFDGRRQCLLEGNGAVPLQRQCKAGNRARNPCGQMGKTTAVPDHLAGFVLEHGFCGGSGRFFAIINGFRI